MIVRQQGGDALGLMSALLFTLSLLNYLWFQQNNTPDTPISWVTMGIALGPLWITALLFLILFFFFRKAPKKSAFYGMFVWLCFSLFYLGTILFSDQPLSSTQFFQYVILCGLGFFFLYSTRLQAIRFEQHQQK